MCCMSNNLTYYERQKLEWLLRTSQSLRKIAVVMCRNVSILSREIKRNSSGRKKYRADVAQKNFEERKEQKRRGKLDMDPELCKYVEEKLALQWSPEQISERLEEAPPEHLRGKYISHESIYHWIYEKSEKYKQLHKNLRTYRPKRKRSGKRKHKKTAIPSRVSIHERPETITHKLRYGDWESDTMEFQRNTKKPPLSVQYERKSQLVRIHKLENKSAEETKEALLKTAESIPRELFHSMTFDNGTEGTKHTILREYYGIDTYFCDPFASWQKGGVENMNKLLRQYLPRSTNLHELSDEQPKAIQERLNNRPRKSLNYQTPNEVIQKVLLS